MRTLVVLPTFCEAANIAEVLRRLREAVPGAHVLVVDDSSPDGTAGVVRRLAESSGPDQAVHLITREVKMGLGSAYRGGFAWGLERGYEALVEMDSDLSHDPAALPELIGAIESGADLAVGSRYVPGGSIPDWPAHRRLLSRAGNAYSCFALRLPVQDMTSGYRAYSARALSEIDLGAVRADGYGFQIEMVHKVAALGGKIVEVPISFVDRKHGHSKMSARTIVEALGLVTLWGVQERLRAGARWARSRR